MTVIKVAIVEDEPDIARLLSQIIEASPAAELRRVFSSAEDFVATGAAAGADVVLLDIGLPGMSGIDFLRQHRQNYPQTQFVMCTVFDDEDRIFESLKAGAVGYLLKNSPPAKIIEAITDVMKGGSPMSSAIARKIVEAFRAAPRTNPGLEMLTAREKDILLLMNDGFRYKEIAVRLYISIDTVRTHIRNIYQKLEVNSRTDALNKVGRRKLFSLF